MADIYATIPATVGQTETHTDGVVYVAEEIATGILKWALDRSAANHPYSSLSVVAGDTVTTDSAKTEIVVDASVANDHADGTLITDPFDATMITLADGTVDNQIAQIHRDGAFVVAIDATMTLPDTGIEIHTDHEIGRLQWDTTAGVWNDITNDRVDAVEPTIDTVMSASSTNAVENQAIVNTLASDTGTLTLNGGVY